MHICNLLFYMLCTHSIINSRLQTMPDLIFYPSLVRQRILECEIWTSTKFEFYIWYLLFKSGRVFSTGRDYFTLEEMRSCIYIGLVYNFNMVTSIISKHDWYNAWYHSRNPYFISNFQWLFIYTRFEACSRLLNFTEIWILVHIIWIYPFFFSLTLQLIRVMWIFVLFVFLNFYFGLQYVMLELHDEFCLQFSYFLFEYTSG